MIKKILTVYLAGRIDGLTKSEAGDWRKEGLEKLQAKKFSGLCPIIHGFDLNGNPLKRDQNRSNEIFEIDCDLIYRSDAILANLGTLSFGTAQELFYASQILGIPTFGFNYQEDSAFAFVTIDKFYEDIDTAIEGMLQYNIIHAGNSLQIKDNNKYKLPPERLKPRNA